MDTTAYLTNQGWLGAGHSLHPTGRGIKKPLLVSRKSNVLGIGKKKHDAHADQWWARAFDSSLKGLEVGTNETTGVTDSVKSGAWGALDMIKAGGKKWAGNGGLYAAFVRGEGLSGTMTPETPAAEELDRGIRGKMETQGIVERVSKTRKRTVEDHEAVDRKAERRKKKKEAAAAFEAQSVVKEIIQESDITVKMLLSKKERRQRRKEHKLKEGRGTAIIQSMVAPDPADGPRPGKRKQRKDEEAMLEIPSVLVATKQSGKKNGSQEHPTDASSEHRGERIHKKDRKSDFQ